MARTKSRKVVRDEGEEEEEEKENRFDSDNESEADGVVIAKALMAEGGKPKIKKKKSIF